MIQDSELGRILVVDDNKMNLDVLENILSPLGYKVFTALDGVRALECVAESNPELVLLDINMPKMDGYEVCRRLKSQPDTASVPVIFISALDDTENIIKAFDVGGVDFVTKPFNLREIRARVATHLKLYRHQLALEAARQREKQQFMTIDAMRKQFIGSATHDLKNPIAVISGYVDVLELQSDLTKDPGVVQSLQAIRRGALKLNSLVTSMLDLLQLESQSTLQTSEIDMVKLVQDNVADMALRARKKELDFGVVCDESCIMLAVDASRIVRVLDNVVSNAIKYTPEGGRVEVALRDEVSHVVISVSDTGLGIPEDSLSELFEPFQRIKSTAHLEQEGTGLGLSIVKTIVEQHGGTIGVTSELGKGSIFTISLPKTNTESLDVEE